MDDVSRGLLGRRVCGGIEIGFGTLLLIGSISTADIFSILAGVFIIVVGVLGVMSKTKGLVIAYMVTGIICALILGISIIVAVVALISLAGEYTLDGTALAIIIVAMVITFILLVIAVLGVIFACLPLRANGQDGAGAVQQQYNTSPPTVAPPQYQVNTSTGAYGPQYNYGNTVVTKPGPI